MAHNIFKICRLLILACSISLICNNAYASKHWFVNSEKYASLVVSGAGKIVHAKNAHFRRHPASLVKVMTLYIIFDEIKKGKLTLTKKIKISKNAASQPRTNLNLKPGTTITISDAILALTVKSANDVAVAVAEAISGSEAKFVERMNAKAQLLNMRNTTFYNASGLPHKSQVTTAYDMGLLALAMQRNHAKFYHLFSRTSFKFGNQVIKGHNHVLKKNKWIDGMKTGFINDSGFNIITTAKRPEGRLIAVVMGGDSAHNRDRHTIDLLQSAYNKISPIKTATLKQSNIKNSTKKTSSKKRQKASYSKTIKAL